MSADAASLAAELLPVVSAAVGAYGTAVLTKVEAQAADATVGFGLRLLRRVFGPRTEGEPLPEPLVDLVADPEDSDAQMAVRLVLRKALAADPELLAETRSVLAQLPGPAQHVQAGRDAYTAGRDQTIFNVHR